MSLAIEVGELLEHFQWLTDVEAARHVVVERRGVAEELADVVIYAIQLADVAGIDLGVAISEKIAENAQRYPAELARDTSRKHTNLRAAGEQDESARLCPEPCPELRNSDPT
jgi:dCTP diphosphatase